MRGRPSVGGGGGVGRPVPSASFDRLLNKLMHPPLESLRDESRHGIPHALLEALAKLFRLRD